jgi:hypothetical protein
MKFLFFLSGLFYSLCVLTSQLLQGEGYIKEDPRVGTGGFRGELIGPANYGVSLWRNEVENVDFRPQTYAETFNILTKDELNIAFRFQTIIKVKSGGIKIVVEEYAGSQFYNRYIKEPLRAMVRNNVQAT